MATIQHKNGGKALCPATQNRREKDQSKNNHHNHNHNNSLQLIHNPIATECQIDLNLSADNDHGETRNNEEKKIWADGSVETQGESLSNLAARLSNLCMSSSNI